MGELNIKEILKGLDTSGIKNKKSRRSIIDMLKVYKDYPGAVEDILLHKKLPFQKEILDYLGLGENIQNLIEKYIENKNFNEDNQLFKELNLLFEVNYDVAGRVYKYDNIHNSIKLIYGNLEEFAEKIKLSNSKDGDYMTEIESIKKDNDSKFFYNKSIKSFGSKGSIGINILDEKFILVFGDNKTPEKDIKKIRSLFDVGNLGKIIKSNLLLIREKYKDGLTSLYNYRYIKEVMEGKASSIIFIDINEMKKINDICGYVPANEIIKEISHILLESVKHGDKVCRFGGDEFVIFINGNDEDIISNMKERIELKIQERNNKNDLKVNISIGFSIYDKDKDFDTRLSEAGMDMKENKESDGKIYRLVSDAMDFTKEDQSKTATGVLGILDPNERQNVVKENCSIAKAGKCSGLGCPTKEEEEIKSLFIEQDSLLAIPYTEK